VRQVAHLYGTPLVVAILILVWTGMMVLAKRAPTKISPRVQRIAFALCVAVTAALLA